MKHPNRVRELRERKRMDAGHLAVRMGVHTETLRAWELGKHEPSFTQGLRLARYLGVSPRQLGYDAEPEGTHP